MATQAPPKASDDPDVQAHYLANAAVLAALGEAVRSSWPEGGQSDPADLTERLTTIVAALVDRFGRGVAALAADQFETMRKKANVTSPFTVPTVGMPPTAKIRSGVDWAVQDLAPDSLDAQVEAARTKVVGVAQKDAADVGRNQMLEAIEADKEARGWARVTKPGACFFCTMLATRGAVYQSEDTAGLEKNAKFVGAGEFKFHDHCRCTVQPLFGRHYEPPAHIRQATALYKSVTDGERGHDKITAFRRAWEARQREEE